MRRSDRLFDIIQALRSARRPITATTLARQLEVSARTVYRDIATLQARRIPIEGEAGIGYVLRRGYNLPPLSFTSEEIEAIAVGARLIRRLRDHGLDRAARRVLDKIAAAIPEPAGAHLLEPPIWVSEGDAAEPKGVDPALLRGAIKDARKLRIAYLDAAGTCSERVVRPVAMVYYVDVSLLAAWCEMRSDYRHFRIERITRCGETGEGFTPEAGGLLAGWQAAQARGGTAGGRGSV